MTFRDLSAEDFKKHAPAEEFGPAPMMEWLDLKLLVVDEGYQRAISGRGKSVIASIIREFSWSKFQAVLVAPIEGGFYSIIDGQHRSIAALACGIEKVPCQIIQASRSEQAEAFAAVNDRRTRMHPITLYHARIASGETEALRLADVCNRANASPHMALPCASSAVAKGDQRARATRAATRPQLPLKTNPEQGGLF